MDQNKKAPLSEGSSSFRIVQDPESKSKYTKYQNEIKDVKSFLTTQTATQTMVSIALGIYRPNLCRIKVNLQSRGLLVETHKGTCQATGYRASYLTCNPQLIEKTKKGGDNGDQSRV